LILQEIKSRRGSSERKTGARGKGKKEKRVKIFETQRKRERKGTRIGKRKTANPAQRRNDVASEKSS